MKYIAYLIQSGEGCDYTIACGETIIEFDAQSREEAINVLKDEVIGKFDKEDGHFEDGYWGESELENVRLFEVLHEIDIPLSNWYLEGEKIINQHNINESEANEKKEYERLKRKFET